MNLYFRGSSGDNLLVCGNADFSNVLPKIRELCSKNHYDIPYIKKMVRGHQVHYDVGLCGKYFILELNEE